MNNQNPKVDRYFEKAWTRQEAVQKLRVIALGSGLTEELKRGCPCYVLDKSNVFLIHDFKNYCALLFMKGVLMKDPQGLLIQQTEHVQSARQIRFTSAEQIDEKESVIKDYIQQAIEVEKAGLKVELKKVEEFKVVEEFQQVLDQMQDLKEAFGKLTPGRQRAYLLFFSSAKQSLTRHARVEKYIEQILAGKGLEDE